MKLRINSRLNWWIVAVVVTGLLGLAFVIKPHSTQDYVAMYKADLKAQSVGALYAEPAQTIPNNGNTNLKATIEAVTIGAKTTQILGCFDLPDTGPWDPDSSITVDGKEITWTEFHLLNPKDSATYSSANRCYLLIFPYGNTSQKKINLKLSVSLTQQVNHGLLNSETGQVIKGKLQKQYPQLDFEVVTQNNGQGGGQIIFNSKPVGMSDEEALGLINDAMTDHYSGSWNFDINVP